MKITTVPKAVKDSINRVSLWCLKKEDEFEAYFKEKYGNDVKILFRLYENTNSGTFYIWIRYKEKIESAVHADPEVLFLWADEIFEKETKDNANPKES